MAKHAENIRQLAGLLSNYAKRTNKRYSEPSRSFEHLSELAEFLSLKPLTANQGRTVDGCLKRYSDLNWWRRGLDTISAQGLESHLRKTGNVSDLTGKYVSDFSFGRFLRGQEESRRFLERTRLESQDGDELMLSDIFDHSVANPSIRRMEMMTRIRGTEEYALAHGYESVFITLTLPSRFHASLKKGYKNPKFDQSTPKSGNDHLIRLWKLIRSKYGRDGIAPFGIRVVEPHHDGTPHWHLLMFVQPNQKASLIKTFTTYVQSDLESAGELDRRLDVTYIDPDKGSAVGYVAKYVSKNINGSYLDTDKSGLPIGNTPTRIRAWASLWKIRQFQFMGTPPVGVWRELRRLNSGCGLIEKARSAADQGDWRAYAEAMSGGEPEGIQLMRAHTSTVNMRSGEYITTELNGYGEPTNGKVIGVMCGILKSPTRLKHWLGKHYEPLSVIGLVSGANKPISDKGSTAPEGRALGLV